MPNNIVLGGALTQGTTITHGAHNLVHNLTGTGDFFITKNTTEDILGVYDNGVLINSDGRADVYFRVESDDNEHMLFVDAAENRVGIGESSPIVPLHVYATLDRLLMIEGEDHSIIEVRGTDASERSIEFTTTGTLDWKIGMDNVAAIEDNFVITQTNNSASPDLMLQTNGELRVESLSGTGTRMVVADADGDLSTHILGDTIGGYCKLYLEILPSELGASQPFLFQNTGLQELGDGKHLENDEYVEPRTGIYRFDYGVNLVSVGVTGNFQFDMQLYKGNTPVQHIIIEGEGDIRESASGGVMLSCAAGDIITLGGYVSTLSGSSTRKILIDDDGSYFMAQYMRP